MTYQDLQNQYGFSDFLTGERIIDGGSMEQNINGDGKLTFSWRQQSGGSIPIGTTIEVASHKYIMMQTYVPTANNDGTYSYSPSFSEYVKLAEKTVFKMAFEVQGASEAETADLYTFPYYGAAGTLVAELSSQLQEQIGQGYTVTLGSDIDSDALVNISVDGDSIKSICDKVASSLGTQAYYVSSGIQIGGSNAFSADGYFNRFVVLGGTRNMAKKTLRGMYAAVTQRLTLGNSYPGSVIDVSSGVPKLTKILIFDDVYPKIEMTISSVVSVECYVVDQNGEKVVDHYDENEEPVYKTYYKYYVSIGIDNGNVSLTDQAIEGMPLGIQFQNGSLAGREFDLAAFDGSTTESENHVHGAYTPGAGMFRLITQADGALLLPSPGLEPHQGDKVTPLNVGLDDSYVQEAQEELKARADSVIPLYTRKQADSFTAETTNAQKDFLTGESIQPAPSAGTPYGSGADGYVVTSVTTDLMSGATSINFGTFKKKGLLQQIVDKVEGSSVSGTSGFMGLSNEDGVRKTSPMGLDQWKALRDVAGGTPASVSNYNMLNEINETLETFGTNIGAIEAQADKSFDIHFFAGTPTPSLTVNTTSGPSAEWTTDDVKEQHLYDICYDTTRDAGSTGGRAYRWLRVALDGQDEVVVDANGNPVEYDPDEHVGSKWCWVEITDLDTRATLEKIADVASDGILTAGTEKVRILADWKRALNEYTNYYENQYGVSTSILTAFKESFAALAKMLNDDVAWVGTGGALPDPVTTPNWINATNISHDTVLSEKSYEDGEGVTHTVTSAYYNARWDTWYAALAQLLEAATGEVKNVADSKMRMFVQVDLPSAPYKVGDMWHKREQAGQPEGDNYLCIQDCTGIGADQPSMSHWMIQDANKDMMSITNVLGELGTAFPGQAAKYSRDCKVTLKDGSTAPSGAEPGDLWYNGNAISEYKPPYTGESPIWQQITNAEGLAAFQKIASLIGLDDEVFYFRQSMSGNSAVKYDIYSVVSMYRDAITNQDVSAGGASVWVYDGTVWQHVIDNVVSMIQNLGKHIVLAVFGQNDGSTNYAGQIAVSPKMVAMVNEAISNETGTTTALAAIKTILETNQQGQTTGKVHITGDKIDFQGKQIEFARSNADSYAKIIIGLTQSDYSYHQYLPHGDALLMMCGYNGVPRISFGVNIINGNDVVVSDIDGIMKTKGFELLGDLNDRSDVVTFETVDGKYVTVAGGIIVDIN